MRRILVLLVVILIVIGGYEFLHRRSAHSGAANFAAAEHRPAPGFSLQDVHGQPLDLSSYRGKVILLDFWATWCAPCRTEIPHFVEFQDKYGAQGLQVIGISMDDGVKPVQEFYQQFKMNYPVAVGTAKLADSYGGVLGLPVTFLINRQGNIAAKYVGATEMSIVEQQIRDLLKSK